MRMNAVSRCLAGSAKRLSLEYLEDRCLLATACAVQRRRRNPQVQSVAPGSADSQIEDSPVEKSPW
jgi:hypothetical protein